MFIYNMDRGGWAAVIVRRQVCKRVFGIVTNGIVFDESTGLAPNAGKKITVVACDALVGQARRVSSGRRELC